MLGAHSPVDRQVPPRALWFSVAALAVPVGAAFFAPEAISEFAALLWLLALIPALLLAYYRGWRGVATALAFGMATLSVTQAILAAMQRTAPDLLLGVVIAYLAISLGLGWFAEVVHRERARVEALALTDPLTELPNRRHVYLVLGTEFAAAQRGRPLVVGVFDLDNFKAYNDLHGHLAGDKALQAFARGLRETTRKMNLSGRVGGEEFLSVLSTSDLGGATVFAERVLAALRSEKLGDGPLSVSCGLAAYTPEITTMEELVAEADRALYRAKDEGRNRVCVSGITAAIRPRDSSQGAPAVTVPEESG